MSMYQVLIVEDDLEVLGMLSVALEVAGFRVHKAESAKAAFARIAAKLPDIVLVDWMMPNLSGLELCRQLRRNKNTSSIPLVFITARGEEEAKIKGLEIADDYIIKPFSQRELIARMNAILRRTSPFGIDRPIEINNLRVDPVSKRVTSHGIPVKLSPIEYRLLHFFMSQPEKAFSRTQLLDHVWGINVYIEERTVDVHIRRLRNALGKEQGKFIETIRGTGYRFTMMAK